jgi:two-component sensor histidine kinase
VTGSTPPPREVVPPLDIVKTWPKRPHSVGEARRLLVRSLDAWGMPHLAENAELVVSELVTNSVRHARVPNGHVILTRFACLGGAVRIEVHDANTDKPEVRSASPDEESGRGLALVDLITGGRWGVGERKGPGKMVWAECVEGGAAEV